MRKYLLLIIISIVFLLTACIDEETISPEEEEKQHQEYIKNNTKRYEVLSVYQYVHRETNGFGGVTDESICYHFTYLDNNKLRTYEEFENLPYGITHLKIGKKDEYVTNPNGKYLYLTKETLKKMRSVE